MLMYTIVVHIYASNAKCTIRMIKGEMFRRDGERKKGWKRETLRVMERRKIKGRRMKNKDGEDEWEILKKTHVSEEDEERQTQWSLTWHQPSLDLRTENHFYNRTGFNCTRQSSCYFMLRHLDGKPFIGCKKLLSKCTWIQWRARKLLKALWFCQVHWAMWGFKANTRMITCEGRR